MADFLDYYLRHASMLGTRLLHSQDITVLVYEIEALAEHNIDIERLAKQVGEGLLWSDDRMLKELFSALSHTELQENATFLIHLLLLNSVDLELAVHLLRDGRTRLQLPASDSPENDSALVALLERARIASVDAVAYLTPHLRRN